MICEACKQPLNEGDFYVNAFRFGTKQPSPDPAGLFEWQESHFVHVPSCPSSSVEAAFALAGVDYDAAMRGEFKRTTPAESTA